MSLYVGIIISRHPFSVTAVYLYPNIIGNFFLHRTHKGMSATNTAIATKKSSILVSVVTRKTLIKTNLSNEIAIRLNPM